MATFDSAHCHEKGIGSDPSVSGKESCPAYMALTPEQKIQLSVPLYKQRKGKQKEKTDNVDKTDKLVVV